MAARPTSALFIASDHAGFALKERLKARLPRFQWMDLGPMDSSRVDYPDYADRVVKGVLVTGQPGILICGSGQGMAIRANRYRGIRAALVWDEASTRWARAHNNANVLCLGARLIESETAIRLVELFTLTPFEGGRHQDRVDKLDRPTGESC